jgi:hypothetical protein
VPFTALPFFAVIMADLAGPAVTWDTCSNTLRQIEPVDFCSRVVKRTQFESPLDSLLHRVLKFKALSGAADFEFPGIEVAIERFPVTR